ncbi:hypothetical protein [uncultured Roseobacter sp.]|uniref:hypothetical protein n=1 Tax=uncultured Roseobacter sp. TaxID=114847 RepID=UPI00262EBD68|nr:hypothetical protein [uncultured Roseobacter sp.]
MTSKAKNRRKRLGKRKCVSLPDLPMRGDHGTGTQAAREGTVIVPMKDDPNRRAYVQRVDAYKRLSLTMRQEQAAKAIRDAYCRVESLSSGGPIKERVQASPKPDATIDVQVDAQSQLHFVMAAVPCQQRFIVEHILWKNQPLRSLKNAPRSAARLRATLDLVANHIGY